MSFASVAQLLSSYNGAVVLLIMLPGLYPRSCMSWKTAYRMRLLAVWWKTSLTLAPHWNTSLMLSMFLKVSWMSSYFGGVKREEENCVLHIVSPQSWLIWLTWHTHQPSHPFPQRNNKWGFSMCVRVQLNINTRKQWTDDSLVQSLIEVLGGITLYFHSTLVYPRPCYHTDINLFTSECSLYWPPLASVTWPYFIMIIFIECQHVYITVHIFYSCSIMGKCENCESRWQGWWTIHTDTNMTLTKFCIL